MKKIKIKITPHDLQKRILEHPARFKVVDCGRRFGKSILGHFYILDEAVKRYNKENRKIRAWVVSPTFSLVKEDWRIATDLWKDIITDKNKTEMRVEVLSFLDIEFKSADREDEGLRGAGLDILLVDEAARVSRNAWLKGLRPALTDKEGVAMFISTPKGQNWFFDLFLKGQKDESEYKSWKFRSIDNPYFPISEWYAAKKELPEHVFKQEFEAEFLEDEALVFRGVDKITRTPIGKIESGYEFEIGVDLAKTTDFNVITIFDKFRKEVCEIDRTQNLEWTFQKKRIMAYSKKYNNARITMDATGLGDPIYDDLINVGLTVCPYKFTNESKKHLIEKLSIAIEQKLIGIPRDDNLLNELKAYTYEVSPSGKILYSAPKGLYDDCVDSLALAIWNVDLYRNYKPKPRTTTYYKPSPQTDSALAG